MIENLDITSANAELFLTVEGIFPSGFKLEMFGTDQAYNMDAIDITETRKGVDGKLVAGYVPVIYPVTITLEASSPSRYSLSTVWESMVTNKKVYAINLVAMLPSLGERLIWSTGVLKNGQVVPSAQKTLSPTTWQFHFQDFWRAKI